MSNWLNTAALQRKSLFLERLKEMSQSFDISNCYNFSPVNKKGEIAFVPTDSGSVMTIFLRSVRCQRRMYAQPGMFWAQMRVVVVE